MTALESFTSGEPIAVDFTAIERELASLWKTASVGEPGASGQPAVTRACQVNLIVLCASAEEATRATATLAPVMRECPARVLMAVFCPEDEGLSAAISAHCIFVPGAGAGRQVCCEQVTLRAGGEAVAHLPGAVLPLLLPDLPVVVWWPDAVGPGVPGRAAAEAHARLAQLADRLVFDSRRMSEPAPAWITLADLGRPVADLSWFRLAAWRELTAALFDGQAFLEYPPRLRRIAVTRAEGGRSHAESLLLGSWVASRLGWRPLPGDGAIYHLVRPDGALSEIALETASCGGPPDRVVALSLQDTDISFRLSRCETGDTISAAIELPGTCPVPRTIRSVERDEPTLLCRALLWGAGGEPVYNDTLRLAARLEAPHGREPQP